MPFGFFVEVNAPADPDYGIGSERPGHPPVGNRPVDPGFGLPMPPIVDNGTPPGHAGHPLPPSGIAGHPLPPTYPVDPDYGIPNRPNTWPSPPGHAGHPLPPVRPDVPVYPVAPDQPPPLPPGAVYPPLPPEAGTDKLLCFVWVVGYGYRWTVIDPSIKPPEKPKPPAGGGGQPGNPLPPSPGPKQ